MWKKSTIGLGLEGFCSCFVFVCLFWLVLLLDGFLFVSKQHIHVVKSMNEKDHKNQKCWWKPAVHRSLAKSGTEGSCPEITFALSTSIDCFYNKHIFQLTSCGFCLFFFGMCLYVPFVCKCKAVSNVCTNWHSYSVSFSPHLCQHLFCFVLIFIFIVAILAGEFFVISGTEHFKYTCWRFVRLQINVCS